MVEDVLSPMRDAAQQGLNSYASLLGINVMPLAEFRQAVRNMTPDDLDMLAEEFGFDQVLHMLNKAGG